MVRTIHPLALVLCASYLLGTCIIPGREVSEMDTFIIPRREVSEMDTFIIPGREVSEMDTFEELDYEVSGSLCILCSDCN